MKNIAILGSTGSIGQNTLKIARHFPDKFRVVALSTRTRLDILRDQIEEFSPRFVCVGDPSCAKGLGRSSSLKVFIGEEGLRQMVRAGEIDEVVLAISGSAALPPLLEAIGSRKDIVLANKEALVMAGPILVQQAKRKKVRIKPVDSEQSAIWQCLQGQERGKLKHIYLTATGGPFREASAKELRKISVSDALRHPRWKMGEKITVDSATLMNKGLELLEAMYLFDIGPQAVKILIHPEAIIHSMVEFIDGVILAQMSVTDMCIPIQYALTYPERLPCNSLPPVDFFKLRRLTFQKPDFENFPCLRLAYRVAEEGGTMPCVMNAANEVGVEAFLKGKLDFVSIPKIIEKTLDKHRKKQDPGLQDILAADAWARTQAEVLLSTSS